ncbi:MAG: aldehyde dehydrogenase family protein [Thermoplasmata archaeon]|nr:aldehyde dehydrogenase family protein [Thermoplasmata archaeon]
MMQRSEVYINGNWVSTSGKGKIDVINPATEELIGSVPVGDANDVNDAVAAARAAFPSWSQSTVEERQGYLNALSASIAERTDEIAELISSEVGTPINYSKMAMVGTPRVVSRSYAKLLDTFVWETEVRNSLIVKEPIGVVGMITPWNFPLHQIIGKVAPALAAGCTMVLKPSKEAPLNAFILADIMDDIGIPAGVFNLVSGHGREIGDSLASHPEVDMVSFTGSTSAGVSVSQAAAPTVKRVTLELGGKSANVILDDADIAKAAKMAVYSCFNNSGQECSSLSRLLVPVNHRDEVVDTIKNTMSRYSVGNPMDESIRCGPMVSERQQKSVSGYISSGIAEGATLVAGGEGMPEGLDNGYFVKPTVFADVTPDMTIFREEIFGPVLTITTYETEEEAITLANDSEYGLSGGVWSSNEDRAMGVARALRTGQVSINGGPFNISAPFGGYKLSGNGRELGVYGLDEFLEVKSIQR